MASYLFELIVFTITKTFTVDVGVLPVPPCTVSSQILCTRATYPPGCSALE